MDRTTEFFGYLKQEVPCVTGQKSNRAQMDQITKEAQGIRENMQHAESTLSELKGLVFGSNVISEYDQNIQDMITALKQEFFSINTRIDGLEGMRNKPRHLENVMKSLRRELKELTVVFNEINEQRIDKIRRTTERRRQFGVRQTKPQYFQTTYNTDEVEFDAGQQDQMLIQNDRERYEQVRGVESMVHDISKLFANLAEVISQADEAILRIDENTLEAEQQITEGIQSVKNYWNLVKGNRGLMIKIFVVVIIFALVFVLIV